MTQYQILDDVITWALVVVFWLSVLAPAFTSLFWRWWHSVWGWNIVGLELCIAGTIVREAYDQMFGHRPNPYNLVWLWEETITFCGIGVFILWRTIVIYRVQSQSSGSRAREKAGPV